MGIKNFISNNYKIVIGFIIGGIVFGGIGVYAVTTKEVAYDNSTSKLTSTNMQGAIDELNTKATTKIAEAEKKCPEGYICNAGSGNKVSANNSNILKAYSYNLSTCVTGEEETCKETNCINYTGKSSCPAGTIIKYKVNSSTEKYFHVLHDDGETMTLQQRENTVNNVVWNSSNNYSEGPTTALQALEDATSNWTNVENQTYTMGTTNFYGPNAYTGCNIDSNCLNSEYSNCPQSFECTTNTYKLGSRTARARMITAQEAVDGCFNSSSSYWTMTSNSMYTNYAWTCYGSTLDFRYGNIDSVGPGYGARAVVVISK